MNKITASIIEKINCPYQVFESSRTADEVQAAYINAKERGKREGFTPILVVSDEVLEEWLGILADESYSREAELAQVSGRGAAILQERYGEYTKNYSNDTSDNNYIGDFEGAMSGERAPLHDFSAIGQFDGNGIHETVLFEIPVKNPWEAVAWVPMGGWNECPKASQMMDVCRYWYEKYQAVPAVVSHDVLEFYVGKPVLDEDEAMKLAKEHYAFCPDRVDACTPNGTIGEVADTLIQSDIWFFWWD